MLFRADTSSHWELMSHCRLEEHLSYVFLAWPHTHVFRRLSHPYLLMPGSAGSAHEAHMMNSLHSLVLQHVLAAEQANREFCARSGLASAQHWVETSEVVPALVAL
jgi:hypothetical protein